LVVGKVTERGLKGAFINKNDFGMLYANYMRTAIADESELFLELRSKKDAAKKLSYLFKDPLQVLRLVSRGAILGTGGFEKDLRCSKGYCSLP
jgi:hypothetical protein